jgi:hypothetical protein
LCLSETSNTFHALSAQTNKYSMWPSPRFLCRLTALIKLLVAFKIPLSFNGIDKVACSVQRLQATLSMPLNDRGISATSNFINAVKRQRNLGLYVAITAKVLQHVKQSTKTIFFQKIIVKSFLDRF